VARVPPSRHPSRTTPTTAAPQAKPKRPSNRLQLQKELKLKPGESEDSMRLDQANNEAQLVAEHTAGHSMQELAHAIFHSENHGAEASEEAQAESHEKSEHEEDPAGLEGLNGPKPGAHKGGGKQPFTPKTPHQPWQEQGLNQKPRDGFFEKTELRPSALTTSVASLRAVQSKLESPIVKTDRPPDVYSLLREAKERGLLFQEDLNTEDHSEERDDPELAAAVEEVISCMSGKAGVLRVGPGRDEAQNPVVVVVATHGFSDASFAAIPERAGRFLTVLALSFELLPLRRER
jgi:hypothetical protein